MSNQVEQILRLVQSRNSGEVQQTSRYVATQSTKQKYLSKLGWSARVDDLLAPYVEKSYNKYFNELVDFSKEINGEIDEELLSKKALEKARRDLEQGIQGLEYKLNSVASSRGDYPSIQVALYSNIY